MRRVVIWSILSAVMISTCVVIAGADHQQILPLPPDAGLDEAQLEPLLAKD